MSAPNPPPKPSTSERRRPAPTRVLVMTPTHPEARELADALSAAGAGADVVAYSEATSSAGIVPTAMPGADIYALAVLISWDPDGEGEAAGSRWSRQQVRRLAEHIHTYHDCPILLVGDHRRQSDLLEIFQLPRVTHLVARDDPRAMSEVSVTLDKVLQGDLFGLEKYLKTSASPQTHTVRSSSERDSLVDAVGDYALDEGVHRRIARLAQSVADEFIMNAIYNAPVDASGRRLYADRDRTDAVELPPEDAATFRYVLDEGRLLLSIFDKFGSLDPETVRSYLVRCLRGGDDQIEQKAGGAGLGMFTILESVNKLIVNIVPGEGTEMIGVLDTRGSFRTFARRSKSFHLFVG